jgi:hypothetical protein
MQYGKNYNFHWLEQGLNELGFRLVVCSRSADSFSKAREERLKVSGKPSQYADLNIFINEQEVLKRFAGASLLETFWIDISDDDVSRAVERIVSWMEATGGLTMPDG